MVSSSAPPHPFGSLSHLPQLKNYRSKKISSWDRTGGNRDFVVINKGETRTLAEIQGAGCITHIWMTVACEDLLYPRKLLLRMYWDNEETPSVEAPLGDFFGVGHGQVSHFISAPLAMITSASPHNNRAAFNCFFPMPFERAARIEVQNDCDRDVYAFFFQISYEEYDTLAPDLARFHAQWRRENSTQGWGGFAVNDPYPAFRLNVPEPLWDTPNLDGAENYVMLETEGQGHFVGCNLSVHNLTNKSFTWFGEGDEMIFVDGEPFPPSIHGTGTEDYFGSAFGFPGKFSAPLFGVSLAGSTNDWSGKWTMYRYHLESPIAFTRSLRVTIEHGHANDRSDDYASVAYWYQAEPHKSFPPMLTVQERMPRAEMDHTLMDFERETNGG